MGRKKETQVTHLSTGLGGKPGSPVDRAASDDDQDAIKSALAGARGIARGRGQKRPRRRKDLDAAGPGGYSGAWPDAKDPLRVGDVLSGYLQDRGWEKPIAQARVFTDWAEIVGADVAAHCAPVALADGELKVSAESTAWATQLRMLGGTLLARVVSELGPTVVTRIVITGPSGPSWKHGKFTVRGQRGPRDTYG
jgi:predicted nucleic acid-binding Zn ribbon protein